jgi:subtilisin family serine protease
VYQTNLTAAQAKEVSKQPFVRDVDQVIPIETATYGTIPPRHALDKRINLNLHLQERENSDDHLRVISQKRDAALDNYLFDPSLGSGQTIYVLDAGFNIHQQDLAANGLRVNTIYIPNSFTLAPQEPNPNLWAPDNIRDWNGHGTAVASVADGITHGVASKADLVLVKFRNFSRNPNPGGQIPWHAREAMSSALDLAFELITRDVLDQREAGNTGKFIVNLSYGKFNSEDMQNLSTC